MPVEGALNAPALTAEVTNTRPPETIGEDQPRPGTSTDQATCSVADQRRGGAEPSAIPFPPGPRNCGQSVGGAGTASAAPASTAMAARAGTLMDGGLRGRRGVYSAV